MKKKQAENENKPRFRQIEDPNDEQTSHEHRRNTRHNEIRPKTTNDPKINGTRKLNDFLFYFSGIERK